ncbi:MAG: hypothetical protein C0506_02650 [Anaerolinea sp.]|nr:hypothetical protein [Anaerolinea sp.]
MTYRLLALDLDGTLLNSQGRVGARDAEALHALAAKGVIIAPATARWYQAARRPFDQLGVNVAAIASAGADVRLADGSVVEQKPLSPAFAAFIAGLCDREGWTATFSVPGRAYTRANDLPPWATNAPEWLQPVTHLRDADLSSLLSVLVETHGSDGGLAEVDGWRDELEQATAVSFAGAVLHTFTAKGVDKGSGLRSLCAAAGIDPSEAVAVGDSEVDLPMFAAAGCAVAMGNSTPPARAAASLVVAGVDEGGVAEAIERLWG